MPTKSSQEYCAWVEGHTWNVGGDTPCDGYVYKEERDCDAIRDARKEDVDRDKGFSSDE